MFIVVKCVYIIYLWICFMIIKIFICLIWFFYWKRISGCCCLRCFGLNLILKSKWFFFFLLMWKLLEFMILFLLLLIVMVSRVMMFLKWILWVIFLFFIIINLVLNLIMIIKIFLVILLLDYSCFLSLWSILKWILVV